MNLPVGTDRTIPRYLLFTFVRGYYMSGWETFTKASNSLEILKEFIDTLPFGCEYQIVDLLKMKLVAGTYPLLQSKEKVIDIKGELVNDSNALAIRRDNNKR